MRLIFLWIYNHSRIGDGAKKSLNQEIIKYEL